MSARLAADAVVLLHLGFIAFAIFGGLLALRQRRWIALHLPALAWAVWIEASHGACPLTGLENRLRRAAGAQGYAEGFIEHWLVPIVYPPGLDARQQGLLALALLLWTGAVYAAVWRRQRRRRKQRTAVDRP